MHQLTEVEKSEELISCNLVWVPQFTSVDNQHSSPQVIFVGEHIHNVTFGERDLLVLRQQTLHQLLILLSELGDSSKLKINFYNVSTMLFLQMQRVILSANAFKPSSLLQKYFSQESHWAIKNYLWTFEQSIRLRLSNAFDM